MEGTTVPLAMLRLGSNRSTAIPPALPWSPSNGEHRHPHPPQHHQGPGAVGGTSVPPARQGPGLAWGRRCLQPRARKGAQRAIEALTSPTQSPLLLPMAPRPQLRPEGASEVPTLGPSAGCGPVPSGTAALPSALTAGSASPCPALAPAPLGKGRSHLAALPSCLLLPSYLLPSAACTYPTRVERA